LDNSSFTESSLTPVKVSEPGMRFFLPQKKARRFFSYFFNFYPYYVKLAWVLPVKKMTDDPTECIFPLAPYDADPCTALGRVNPK
jgi:hypothetical protein